MEIDVERLKRFEKAVLVTGSHDLGKSDQACVMNWANFLAGGPGNSDNHPCVSPVIRRYAIGLNDRLLGACSTDEERKAISDMLKPYAQKILGTKSTPEVEDRRSWLAMNVVVHQSLPFWLDHAGLKAEADECRAFPDVTASTIDAARKLTASLRDKTWPLRQARWQRVRDAVKAAVEERLKGKKYADADAAAAAVAVAAAVADAAAVAAAVADAAAAAVAVAAAVADAAAVAAAVAAAAAVADAAAVAAAVAAAAAAADAVADAVAVAAAVADAAAVAAAVADAAAAAVAVAAAVAAGSHWSTVWRKVYDAVKPKYLEAFNKRFGGLKKEGIERAFALLDAMIAVGQAA